MARGYLASQRRKARKNLKNKAKNLARKKKWLLNQAQVHVPWHSRLLSKVKSLFLQLWRRK